MHCAMQHEEGTSKIKCKRSTPKSLEWELSFSSNNNNFDDDSDSAMPSFIPLYNTNDDLFVS